MQEVLRSVWGTIFTPNPTRLVLWKARSPYAPARKIKNIMQSPARVFSVQGTTWPMSCIIPCRRPCLGTKVLLSTFWYKHARFLFNRDLYLAAFVYVVYSHLNGSHTCRGDAYSSSIFYDHAWRTLSEVLKYMRPDMLF